MAGVTSTLNLEDRMTPVLRSIVKALGTTLTAMAEVDKISSTAFNNASKAIQQASAQVNQLNNAVQNTTPKIHNMGNSFFSMGNNVRNLTNEIGMLIGVYSGLQGIFQIGKGADAFIANTARLDLMNDGLQTTAELQRLIYESSQRSASNYRETTAAVAKLGVTARHAFNNTKEIVAFTELLNKQFQIGGASASEKAGAMYQLTQAMASGRLQGDEFRSILENAPMLMKAIRDYTGMTFAQLKEASTKGLITADLIKKSLFSIADETNTKFQNIPLKFGDLWTQVLNKIDYGLQPLYIKLRGIYNNPEFQQGLTNMINGFLNLVNIGIVAFDGIVRSIAWASDNINILVPLVFGLVGAMIIYKGAAIAVAIANGIAAFSEKAKGAAVMLSTGATVAATAAQWGLNAALYAFPGTWIVLAIIAIIVVIYSMIAGINKLLGTTISATGIIVATIAEVVAVIWNIFVGFINGCVALVDFISNIILSAIENVLNFLGKGFDSFGGFVSSLVGDLINAFLDLLKIVAKVSDAVFGTDWSKGIEGWKTNVTKVFGWGKTNKFTSIPRDQFSKRVEDSGFGRMKYGQTLRRSYNWTTNKVQDIKDSFRIGDKGYNINELMNPDLINKAMSGKGAALDAAKKTAKNTKKTADELDKGVELTSEDIELLKEASRVQFVNRFNTLAPQVSATFGDVHKGADVDSILNILEQALITAADAAL